MKRILLAALAVSLAGAVAAQVRVYRHVTLSCALGNEPLLRDALGPMYDAPADTAACPAVPVSRERYLRACIAEARKLVEELRHSALYHPASLRAEAAAERLERQLAAMGPEERKEPAIRRPMSFELAEPGATPGHRVVTLVPDR